MNFKSVFNFFVFGLALVGSSYVAFLFMPLPAPQPVLVRDYFSYEKTSQITSVGYDICDLLKEDISNGNTRTESYYDSDSSAKRKAKAVQKYVDTSSSMRVSNLPRDFQTAWKKHMQAWRNYSDYLNKNVKSIDNFDEDFYYERENELNNKIDSTWEDVLDIADKYYPDIRVEVE
jgi:hypothetical protein